MQALADIAAILITLLTLAISLFYQSRLKIIEKLLLWLFCIVYLAVFSYSALDLLNPDWLKYGNRAAMLLALADLIYRVRLRK